MPTTRPPAPPMRTETSSCSSPTPTSVRCERLAGQYNRRRIAIKLTAMALLCSPAEPRMLISRSALLHNVSVLRAAAPGKKLCAMLKANAYGHDAWIVADALVNFSGPSGEEAPVVDSLGVATIDEAAALPELPAKVPLLIFQPVENAFTATQRPRIEHAIRNDWHLLLCSKSAADDVARIAGMMNKRANVHVM